MNPARRGKEASSGAMGEVVNLRQFRKRKDRQSAEREADAKRVKHGRTKAEKTRTRQERETLDRHLDGHRLTPDPSPE